MSACISLWISCTTTKKWPNLFFFPLLDDAWRVHASWKTIFKDGIITGQCWKSSLWPGGGECGAPRSWNEKTERKWERRRGAAIVAKSEDAIGGRNQIFLSGRNNGIPNYTVLSKIVSTRLRDPVSWLPSAAGTKSRNLEFAPKWQTNLMEWFGTAGGKSAKSWYCACATATHVCVSNAM